ncbi:MAG: hypothetical protein DHS20C18_31240 [Saprospiraceae bacterium]|nr:MAG: hypothetical protein DHS20C18_31240 [Saprospiraceae bacterium]
MRKANTQYDLHAFNLAIPTYKEALDKRPDSGEALSKLADCYRHLNQMEDAAMIYAQAVRMKDIDKIHILNYGQVLKSLGRYEEAKQFFLLYARDENAMVGNHYAQSTDFARSQLGVNSSYTITNEFINTSASDFGAAFYGKQQAIYSSARTDIQRSSANWSGKAKNQLFLANIGGSTYLESPVFLKSSNKNEFDEGPLTFSPDGRTVVFTKNNFVDGTRQIPSSGLDLKIFMAQVSQNGDWIDIRPFPFNGTGYSTGYPAFSPDGTALYFASDQPGGFGGFDLYVTKWTGNSWTTLENLGPVVNSPGNEITPYYDGNMLYFASDWHQGLGGFDCFRAEATNERWTRIFHLGNAVNSSYDDYGFIYDTFRNIGYLTSNRLNGRGNEDIYRVQRSADYIVLHIKNASDGSPVPNAIVDFSNCGEGVYQSDVQGNYSFQAIQGLNCNLLIRKEGFASSTVQISTIGLNNNREYNIQLTRMSEAYAGKILSYTDRFPLDGVQITATNQATNNSMQAVTDTEGNYFLSLSPYATYVLRLSRVGFKDLNVTVRTEDGLDRSILGVISLIPSNSNVGVVEPPFNGGGNEPDGPVRPQEEIGSGYAVQVAAISSPNLDAFGNLEDLGSVYYKEQNSRYKIRLGVFTDRADADRVLRTAKSRGYPGAFIVKEEGGTTGVKGVDQSSSNNISNSTGRYKVQLGAYSNVKYFNPSQVEDLGFIEERQKGKLTVKYLGGFDSLNEAQVALRSAKSGGFPDAFVVVEENGVLKPVR